MAEDGIQAKVVGFEELKSGSERLAVNIGQSSGAAMQATADRAAGQVRGTVPRLTGALAGSVVTGHGVGRNYGTAFVGMGEGLAYAGWIEYGGTRGRPYVPEGRYVYPAAQAQQGALVDAASANAKREIARFPWSTPNV